MILDVEFYNNHVRQVKDFSLTVATLEEQLKTIHYTGEKRTIELEIEDAKLPPFALPFYSFFYQTGRIPTEDEFVEEYLKNEEIEVMGEKVQIGSTVASKEGLVGRLLRTYPSLIRDFHFYFLALNSGYFEAVRYSFKKDYFGKIDIQVCVEGKWYNVGLLLASKRSLFFRKKKQSRHKPVDVIYIELEDKDAKWVGDFKLYTEKHIIQLVKTIHTIKP